MSGGRCSKIFVRLAFLSFVCVALMRYLTSYRILDQYFMHQNSVEKEEVIALLLRLNGGSTSSTSSTSTSRSRSSTTSNVSGVLLRQIVETRTKMETTQQEQQQQVTSDNNNDHYPDDSSAPTCYVAIENKADYHYEVIESIILQYPLPWEKIGCGGVNESQSQQQQRIVHFDVALAHSHTWKSGMGERASWERYFESDLRGKLRNRTDHVGSSSTGSSTNTLPTLARIGDLVSYTNYSRQYNAYIGVSCDSYNFKPYLRKSSNNFCVLHGCIDGVCHESTNVSGGNDYILKQSCFLTPMHDKETCYFFPSDFPRFDNRPPPVPTLNLCITGGSSLNHLRNYSILADALARRMRTSSSNNNNNNNKAGGIMITLHQRSDNIPSEFVKANLSHLVHVSHEPRYKEFHEAVSRCHIVLPLVGPTSGYFRLKKLTGSLPLIVAHKIPSIMDVALEKAYHDHLTAPVTVYNDSESFDLALNFMIDYLRGDGRTSK